MDSDDGCTPLPRRRAIQFRLGWNTVSATAEAPWPSWKHVLRVTADRGPVSRWLASVLRRLPRPLCTWAKAYFPAWFLPTKLVLKKLKPDWDNEFNDEKAAYERLEELQGHVIPVCYGEGECEGTRCLVLSDVQGVPAHHQQAPPLSLDEYRSRIEAVLAQIRPYGLEYGDPKLANTILTRDGLVLVDLESMYREDHIPGSDVKAFMWEYESYLITKWGIGRPPPLSADEMQRRNVQRYRRKVVKKGPELRPPPPPREASESPWQGRPTHAE